MDYTSILIRIFQLFARLGRIIRTGGGRMLLNLSKLREEKQISQAKLGEIIGVTQPTINKYENHDNQPDFDTLKKIADYFETSVDYLIGHTDIRRRIEQTEAYELNETEQNLIDSFRDLTSEQRQCILMTVKTFLKR